MYILRFIVVVLCFCSNVVYAQKSFAELWKDIQANQLQEGYQYDLFITRNSPDTTLREQLVKPQVLRYWVGKETILFANQHYMVLSTNDKTISVDENSKRIMITKSATTIDKNLSLPSINLIDSLVINSSKVTVKEVGNGLYEYTYKLQQANPLFISIYYSTTSLFFERIVLKQTINSFQYETTHQYVNFSKLKNDEFLKETYFLQPYGQCYQGSLQFSHYQVICFY